MSDVRPVDPAPEDLAEEIRVRGEALRRRIANPEVDILAVTKGHPPEVAMAAVVAGFKELGENYAQELVAKAQAFADAGLEQPDWHFVGRLQSNKVRQLAELVVLWQSVDRTSVVKEISKRAPGAQVLIQVDLAGISGRGGCAPEETGNLVERASSAGLDVRGLMAVGPPGDPELAREGFRWLASEARDMGLPVVSMGMSADLEVAVAEGATMVRIGSALVGKRP